MSDVAAKLREAKALIEPEGAWIQGTFSDRCGGHCVMGAVMEVTTGIFDTARVCDLFAKSIGLPERFVLPKWNDAPERTQAEVLAAFDKAIELAEQSA